MDGSSSKPGAVAESRAAAPAGAGVEVFRIEFDGGARGNPGPAGFGIVVRAADGQELLTRGEFIGTATNNVAEYRGLIAGLTLALDTLGARRAAVFGDSELVIKQMKGQYRVKNAGLRPLFEQARALAERFEQVSFTHIYREQNKLADKLYNRAIDRKGVVTDADE